MDGAPSKRPREPGKPLQVRVVMDSASGPGEYILRGVAHYSHTRTDWMLMTETRTLDLDTRVWANDDALIYAFARLTPFTRKFAVSRLRPVIGTHLHTADHTALTVTVDDQQVGRMAAEFFADRGIRHVAFEAYSDQSVAAQQRYRGFTDRAGELGLEVHLANPDWLEGGVLEAVNPRPDLIDLAKRCPKPMGVFCIHDNLARITCENFFAAGIPVPTAVAVLGCDNSQLIGEVSRPTISSIDCGWQRIGFLVAQKLDHILRGHAPDQRVSLFQPVGIEERESTKVLGINDPRMIHAVQYIREHACDPCGVEDVVNAIPEIGSRRWLDAAFRKHLDQSPHDLITKTRMERARTLLTSSSMGLEQVADRCGYSLVQNFSRVFLRHFGVRPGALRKQHARPYHHPPTSQFSDA